MIDRKPFDGAITRYFADDAPEAIRAALKTAETSDILGPTYPYAARMQNSLYMAEMTALQIELAKFHAWVRETLTRTHTATAPWHVIRADEKRRARLAVIRQILSQYDYPEKDPNLASAPDPAISVGPEAWTDQGDNA
jgi:polyphosphate kinase 2 (PPK2 family)